VWTWKASDADKGSVWPEIWRLGPARSVGPREAPFARIPLGSIAAHRELSTSLHRSNGFFCTSKAGGEVAHRSAGTPGVLREEVIHIIPDPVAKVMTDFPHSVQPGDQAIPAVGG